MCYPYKSIKNRPKFKLHSFVKRNNPHARNDYNVYEIMYRTFNKDVQQYQYLIESNHFLSFFEKEQWLYEAIPLISP